MIQVGTPQDIYDRPANVFVAQLVGSPRINLLPATTANGAIHLQQSPIRPEDVQPQPDGPFPAEIALIEPLGVETILHLRSGEQRLLSLVSGMSSWRIGDTIRFAINRERLHYFDSSGARL